MEGAGQQDVIDKARHRQAWPGFVVFGEVDTGHHANGRFYAVASTTMTSEPRQMAWRYRRLRWARVSFR